MENTSQLLGNYPLGLWNRFSFSRLQEQHFISAQGNRDHISVLAEVVVRPFVSILSCPDWSTPVTRFHLEWMLAASLHTASMARSMYALLVTSPQSPYPQHEQQIELRGRDHPPPSHSCDPIPSPPTLSPHA